MARRQRGEIEVRWSVMLTVTGHDLHRITRNRGRVCRPDPFRGGGVLSPAADEAHRHGPEFGQTPWCV